MKVLPEFLKLRQFFMIYSMCFELRLEPSHDLS